MEKDALLEIIIHDLKEVEMLAQNVKGDTQLSKAFFKLTRNRINSILEEIEMLEELSLPEPRAPEPEAANAAPKVSPAPDVQQKQQSEQKDLTPPPSPETPRTQAPQESASENQPASEPLPKDKVPPFPDKAAGTEKKKEFLRPQEQEERDEEREKEKDISVDEKKQSAPKQPSEKKEEKEKRVLGEKLVKGKDSFNEQIGKNQKTGNHKRSFSTPPVSDLKKAMGINDRFFYQRELFGGNAEVMNQTLEQLNQMEGINEAQNFLLTNFNWDPENEALLNFMELVERRYL